MFWGTPQILGGIKRLGIKGRFFDDFDDNRL
jgi:hypothetical protein